MPPLSYYVNSLDTEMTQQPNDYYRGLQQAFYDAQWENTTARITIQEQDGFGLDTYHNVEVWINKVIGTTTTFMKNGEDYRQLLFQQIDRPLVRGLYYKFDNQFWISDFVNPSQGLPSDVTVRRCNNALRTVDPKDGSIFTIPCVVDYDLTSPTILVNSYILTPNSHAIVYVQANEDTNRLFTLNKRFMLNGRPFKLYAYQDTLNRIYSEESPTVLYLDLYLDELHAQDDVENNVAYNGEINYSLTINSQDIIGPQGSTGTLTATTMLNGEVIEAPVVWESNNVAIVTVKDGAYHIVGISGQTATIKAYIKGNEQASDIVNVKVSDVTPAMTIRLTPMVDKIRQYETVTAIVEVVDSGQVITPDVVEISLSDSSALTSNDYLTVGVNGQQIALTCERVSTESQTIYINIPALMVKAQFAVRCVSMLG